MVNSQSNLNSKQTRIALLVFIILLYVVNLLFGEGHTNDEGEHLHAAYLISSLKLIPHVDFFQHHQSMLWKLLSIIYKFNIRSIETAFILGRILMGIAVLICGYFLWLIVNDHNRSKLPFWGISGLLILIYAAIIFPMTLAIRPETLGLPFFFASYWLWNNTNNKPWTYILSGFLFGLAVYSSPRFLLNILIYFIIFLNEINVKTFVHRFLLLILGMLMSITIYAYVFNEPLWWLSFNLLFSSLLQKVGNGNLGFLLNCLELVVVYGLIFYYCRRCIYKCNLELFVWEIVILINFIISWYSGWPFVYGQNFVPGIAILSLYLTRLETLSPNTFSYTAILSSGYISAALLFVITLYNFTTKPESMLFSNILERECIISMLRPGDKVLVRARYNPIYVRDASYYITPLADGMERLPKTVEIVRSKYPVPKCLYSYDIQTQKPIFVDIACLSMKDLNHDTKFAKFFNSEYIRIHPVLYMLKSRYYQVKNKMNLMEIP